ncbi:TraB family protein, partial [bacterium]|nr:TraB family protein [bacterium]
IELAEEREAKLVNADRDISVTLKRTFRSMSFMEKTKFFTSLFFGDSDDVNTESIEELKKGDMLMQVIGEMGKNFPSLKTHILDERDTYLAVKIASNLGNVTVAVVGAAHVPGILKHLQAEDCGEETLEKISVIPPASLLSKALPWIIPAIIIAVFIYGFAAGDTSKALNAGIWWILINGVLSAIGCIIAAAHPLTILAGFIAAPITSLNPTIGVGVVTGLVQLYLVRPVVRDLQNAPQDTTKLSGWWKNKLTRALLVALLSSLGSAIGTFVALPFVLRILG